MSLSSLPDFSVFRVSPRASKRASDFSTGHFLFIIREQVNRALPRIDITTRREFGLKVISFRPRFAATPHIWLDPAAGIMFSQYAFTSGQGFRTYRSSYCLGLFLLVWTFPLWLPKSNLQQCKARRAWEQKPIVFFFFSLSFVRFPPCSGIWPGDFWFFRWHEAGFLRG